MGPPIRDEIKPSLPHKRSKAPNAGFFDITLQRDFRDLAVEKALQKTQELHLKV
ncbi:MAG: hypothetical protein KAG89_04145 [Fulvimarina manganoxydans]|uniref:hypothetical protein n=1 Tax=Fulvimarina manganoxydans TaxID=937218 RepID=UPI0023528890|nr:hypothetical protein [Fulvimarina manganoxydans]MCK5931342.1 hypothetical protein [Fulvimarina manganoxydans]